MRKIKEVLRLKWTQDLSNRQIAKSGGIGHPTVSEYLRRAEEAGLSWPLPSELDEVALEQRLFPPPPGNSRKRKSLSPYWALPATPTPRPPGPRVCRTG